MTGLANSGFGHLTVRKLLAAVVVGCSLLASATFAQVNSGSDGRDGTLNLTGSLVIDMADHPDGIYQYTSVTIPSGVTVSFVPNSSNSPVVWLVQSNCIINGTISLSGQGGANHIGGFGGPGGFRAGNSGDNHSSGQGPGGGSSDGAFAGNASYATSGMNNGAQPGQLYGNTFLLPLIGGSGGGGTVYQSSNLHGNMPGGGGGGGAILIAASGEVTLNGNITSKGGDGDWFINWYGAGSGGAVRIIAPRISGTGTIDVEGGNARNGAPQPGGGSGRIRFDVFENAFAGTRRGVFTLGFQPVILPTPGQGVQLRIATVGGVNVPANPSDQLANPAVTIPGQQANPVPIVVHCSGIPLNTSITVTMRPATGASISVAGVNDVGTQESSTARVSLSMPRGGGIIFASAVIGVGGNQGASINDQAKSASYAQTGLTTSGERFAKMEITAALGGRQEIAYITPSGKRYSLAAK